ncbi:MAG: aminotransferase [Oscillospiraceae bacterium]|nr:aminotransferase [Oscillospiraceae bacterium]
MPKYNTLTREQLLELRAELSDRYEAAKSRKLNLNMSRGVPSPEQLSLSAAMFDMPSSVVESVNGADCRNYGVPEGIPEARRLMADIMELDAAQVFIGGGSSLNLMHDCLSFAVIHGLTRSEKPWGKLDSWKFLCPSPGYDRHFAITRELGAQLVTVGMNPEGPDMGEVEQLVKDPAVKGIWCVPKYSNPQGITYSDGTVRRIAALKPAAPDFIIMWDNAYAVHGLYPGRDTPLLNLMDELIKNQSEHMALFFASTAKITVAGGGISAVGAGEELMGWVKAHKAVQIICGDKLNQLRHARFLPDISAVYSHMEKHADILRPKFELMEEALGEIRDDGLARYEIPMGGYFISLDLVHASAKRVVGLLSDIGVAMTPAGATFPYGIDPHDRNIRIAPTLPAQDELAAAARMLCLCVRLASVERALENL